MRIITNYTILVICSIFVSSCLFSQSLDWAKSFGGTSSDYGNSITIDNYGNVYTTGKFSGTVDFDPGPGVLNLTSNGGSDIYVQKLNSAGNLVWAKSFGGTYNDEGTAISVDSRGNVYTTGNHYGWVDFDPGVGLFIDSLPGFSLTYVQKLNSSGIFVWATVSGRNLFKTSTPYQVLGTCISVDGLGNVYNAINGNLRVNGNNGSIVQKLDSSGNVVWNRYLFGYATSISIDGQGNICFTGHSGYWFNRDLYVQKFTASGFPLWLKTSRNSGGSTIPEGKSITVDSSGNIYTTGVFSGIVDFDPGPGVLNLTSNGGYDIYVQKLNSAGNLVWAKSFGGTSNDEGTAISVDSLGNLYIMGNFSGTADFDPGSGTVNLTSNGSYDVFMQKLNSVGNLVWVKSFGGTGSDYLNSMSVDGSGNIYTTGFFNGTADFDPGFGVSNLTSNGANFDAYIQKLSICTSTMGIDVQTACNSFTWINGLTYTYSNNTATDTLANAAGCDSVVTLNLIIYPFLITSQPANQTVFVGGNAQFQVTVYGTGLTYQWQQNNGTGFTDISSFGIYSGTSTNALTITGVTAAIQQNVYRCKVSNSNGCLDTTLAAILYISLTTIDENGEMESFKIFPNPATSQLNIETSIAYSSGIIINALGQTVLKFKNETTLDVSNLKAGNYILLVKGENNEVLKREKFNKY